MERDERVTVEESNTQGEAERYLRNDRDLEYEDSFLERFARVPGNGRVTGVEGHVTDEAGRGSRTAVRRFDG